MTINLKSIALGIMSISVVTSCTTDELTGSQATELAEVAGEFAVVSSNFEVKDYTDNVTSDATERGYSVTSSSNARTLDDGQGGPGKKEKKGKGETGKRFHVRHYMDCADITETTVDDTKTVVIDFSNGACESKDGETVSGVVTEVHEKTDTTVSHSTTFADFSENGKVVNGSVAIEGTLTVADSDDSDEGEGKKGFKLESSDLLKTVDLTFSFPATDSTEAYTEHIERSIDEEMMDGIKTVSGSLTVTSSIDGESFTTEITEPLSYNPKCGEGKPVFAPLSGKEVMTKDGETMTLDYGDGSCDYIVSITLADGTTETVDLKDAFDMYGFVGVGTKGGKKGGKKNGRK
ncbi:hypothetical protein [Flammeovirga kamogawensis]|uniref:Uncharacterized protein n=1 Tax=Flammeovirga kamogawensis TaxID=373891 RepID=A0ABX8GQT8_9BACT|nr:hypothetical protein [Flammeovirga kamogawensis]MBB6462127.1 hypothetical protein [Flammeovirga kamogawensis]QWG05861.1 hypothetical protein KM029_10800 [Flammeovirga kamogawensis]TRX67685.1 hypothetical protein EO216_05810 [Flammeovirga kamogawensis]